LASGDARSGTGRLGEGVARVAGVGDGVAAGGAFGVAAELGRRRFGGCFAAVRCRAERAVAFPVDRRLDVVLDVPAFFGRDVRGVVAFAGVAFFELDREPAVRRGPA